MDAQEFFLQEYDTVCWIVNDLFLKDVSDDQMRHQPKEGLNSIAWYLWHTARWQDFANTLIAAERSQILNEQWLNRMKDRKSTRLNSSHLKLSRMPSSA